jgi:hypothetical protein
MLEPRGGLRGRREPVGAVDQQHVQVVGAEQPQRFLGALHDAVGAGVVLGDLAIGVARHRHVDAALGDDLQLGAQPLVQAQRRAQAFLDLVSAVDLGRIDGGDPAFNAQLQPPHQPLGRRALRIVEEPPGAVDQARKRDPIWAHRDS